MIERVYMFCWSCGVLICIALLFIFIKAIWPYIDMIGQGFAVVFVVFTVCLLGLMVVASVQAGKILIAIANRFVAHERLITHKDMAVWIDADGMPLHVSAIHESAKISTFALEQANKSQMLQAELDKPRVDISEDSEANKVANLASQGASERAIAGHLGISRAQVRKLLGR